ncbi:MAG: hypothetical protein RLZZ366_1872 [Pseudomonadota bacterium]
MDVFIKKHRFKNRPKTKITARSIRGAAILSLYFNELYGAGYKIRTRDPLITNHEIALFYSYLNQRFTQNNCHKCLVLSHLSYSFQIWRIGSLKLSR